jgi:hypothetical protein
MIVACLLAAQGSAASEVLWECPKTFTMSSQIGVLERYNGTDYIRYVEGQFICDMKGPDSDDCFWKYTRLLESSDAVVGFLRQQEHPQDTQIIVLDLLNSKFYMTIMQGELRATVFGECQGIGEGRITVDLTPKDYAITLMGPSVFVPGIAAYCDKNVERNQALIEAATNWNRRNAEFHRVIIQVLEEYGGLSKAEREAVDSMAYAMVRNEVEGATDKAAFCANIVDIVNSGQLDLDQMVDTKGPLSRLMERR